MVSRSHALLASTALFLASCGGGGGGGGGPPAPVNTAPVITSPATATAPENVTGTVYQAAATDAEGNAVAFSLGGTDAARFAITPAGAISFVAPPDFEAPADSGANNVYDLILIASDGTASSQIALTVTVTNQPDGAVVRQIATGYVEPRQVVGIPGSNNLFVLERAGAIYLVDPAVGGRGTLFMQLPDVGLFPLNSPLYGALSILPAPDYATSGVFYVSLTDVAGNVDVRRYTRSSPTIGNPASADVIMRLPNIVRNNTAVAATLAFGPDGMLYVLAGENGNRVGVGNPAELRGKVLRIDLSSDAFPADPLRDYRIPADNPSFGGVVNEVAALGIYDPRGASFNGPDLLFGDHDPFQPVPLGGGEINLMRPQDRGANYGFPLPQNNPPPGVTSAVIRTAFQTAGGLVYRGSLVPLRGNYVFSIVNSGLFATPASQLVQGTQASATPRPDLNPPNATTTFIVSLTEDSQGELYYLLYPTLSLGTGELYKIEAR